MKHKVECIHTHCTFFIAGGVNTPLTESMRSSSTASSLDGFTYGQAAYRPQVFMSFRYTNSCNCSNGNFYSFLSNFYLFPTRFVWPWFTSFNSCVLGKRLPSNLAHLGKPAFAIRCVTRFFSAWKVEFQLIQFSSDLKSRLFCDIPTLL